VKENQMQIVIPRKLINMQNKSLQLQFKWVDNISSGEKIESFYTDGDAAPIGRLNYVFTE
jgi:hypothetical protein